MWTDNQLKLVACLAEYDLAERVIAFGGDYRKADKLHAKMFDLAMQCGFRPGRDHWHMSLVEFARQQADSFARTLATHVREITQDNQPAGAAA